VLNTHATRCSSECATTYLRLTSHVIGGPPRSDRRPCAVSTFLANNGAGQIFALSQLVCAFVFLHADRLVDWPTRYQLGMTVFAQSLHQSGSSSPGRMTAASTGPSEAIVDAILRQIAGRAGGA
jgi:hypothetical protein